MKAVKISPPFTLHISATSSSSSTSARNVGDDDDDDDDNMKPKGQSKSWQKLRGDACLILQV